MKRRGPALAGLLLLSLLVFSACAGLGEADGWASPVALDEDANVILVGSGEDRIFAVDVRSGAIIWAFPDNESAFPGLLDEVNADAFYTTPVAASAGGDELIIAEYDGGIVY